MRSRAFSLIELLTVVAIIAVMSVVVAPAMGALVGASGTTRAVNDISGMLDHARLKAMQMSTWVWVGIADTTDQNAGEQRLSAVEVVSRDGTSDLSAANLMQVLKPVHIKLVKTSKEGDADSVVLGSQASGFQFDWMLPSSSGGSKSVRFSEFVIGFSPRGEAVIRQDKVENWIKIRLISGNNSDNNAALLVSGPSGQVIVAR